MKFCSDYSDEEVTFVRRIAFGNDENIQQRAWDGLLPNRILIYCL